MVFNKLFADNLLPWIGSHVFGLCINAVFLICLISPKV